MPVFHPALPGLNEQRHGDCDTEHSESIHRTPSRLHTTHREIERATLEQVFGTLRVTPYRRSSPTLKLQLQGLLRSYLHQLVLTKERQGYSHTDQRAGNLTGAERECHYDVKHFENDVDIERMMESCSTCIRTNFSEANTLPRCCLECCKFNFQAHELLLYCTLFKHYYLLPFRYRKGGKYRKGGRFYELLCATFCRVHELFCPVEELCNGIPFDSVNLQ